MAEDILFSPLYSPKGVQCFFKWHKKGVGMIAVFDLQSGVGDVKIGNKIIHNRRRIKLF